MIRFVSVFCLVAGLSFTSAGQTAYTDSLKQRIYMATDEKSKLKAILMMCDEYQGLNRDTLDYYAYMAKRLAGNIGDKRDISLAAIAVANNYYRWGWSDSALAEIEPVIAASKAADPDTRDIYFKASRQKALYNGSKSKYAEALQILYQLVSEAERYRDTSVMSANMNTIGSIALQREEPYNALRWFSRALAPLTIDKRFDAVKAAIYVNMADGYKMTGKLDSAIDYSNKGVRLFRAGHNLMSLALALQRQSNIYLKSGDSNKAEASLKEMIAVRRKTNDGNMWVDDNLSMVDFYIASSQVDKAIEFCKQLLITGDLYVQTGEAKTFSNNINQRLSYYEALARCYKIKGDNEQYQQALENIIQAKDSFYTVQSELAIAEMQTKYEVQKKENTIIQQQLTIARKNNLMYLSLSGVVVISIISWLIFRDYRKKEKLKVEQMIEKQRTLAEKAIADAEEKERKRIAADLHDNLGAYAASIASNLDILKADNSEDQNKVAMQELNNNSQSMVAQLSDTIWAMNRDTLTLTAISDRIKVFLSRLRQSYKGIEMEVEEDIIEDAALPPTQAFHLFRITQEAVTNAVKHSGARNLKILVEGNDSWQITITDDGKGMDNEKNINGNGLRNMKERAAVSGWIITWNSTRHQGATVVIRSENI